MFKSNYKFYLKSTISATQWIWTTFLISPDIELSTVLETWSENVSIKLAWGTQIERMKITATWWVATIVKRGLTQASDESYSSWLNKVWNDGTIIIITALAFDIFNNQNVIPLKFQVPRVSNTTTRDALYNTTLYWWEMAEVLSLGALQVYDIWTASWKTITDTNSTQTLTNKTVNGVVLKTDQTNAKFLDGTWTYATITTTWLWWMDKSIYDPNSLVNWQVVWLTAIQTLTNKDINGVILKTDQTTSKFLNWEWYYSTVSWISWDPWTPKVLTDTQAPKPWATMTYDDTGKWVKATNTDGSYIQYTETWITSKDPVGNVLWQQSITWTYNATTHSILYTNGNSITSDWNYSFVSGTIAYKDQNNDFLKNNSFSWISSFNWLVLFPYYVNTANTSTFYANNGQKQKFSFTDATTHTLIFQNLKNGWNYIFSIVVSWGSSILWKATTFTDCDTIASMYKLWSTVYPLTLANWVHLFVAEAFSTAIHVSYIWVSTLA